MVDENVHGGGPELVPEVHQDGGEREGGEQKGEQAALPAPRPEPDWEAIAANRQTHIERLNGMGSASHAPGSGVPHPVGEIWFRSEEPTRPYKLLKNSFIHNVYHERGAVVLLQPHEVADHMEEFAPVLPAHDPFREVEETGPFLPAPDPFRAREPVPLDAPEGTPE
jgi:hypothetical protein